MSLELHEDCKRRLTEELAKQLPSIVVNNRMFIDRHSSVYLLLLERVLPTTGQMASRLKGYVSEMPITDFVHDTLAQELFELDQYQGGDAKVSLPTIGGYSDVDAVASRLVDAFDSLPWDYCVSIPLPVEISEVLCESGRKFLSNSISLVRPDETFAETFPRNSGIPQRDKAINGAGLLALFVDTPQWDQNRAYLQIHVSGFIGRYGNGAPFDDALALFRAFCGLGIALRFLKVSRSFRPIPAKTRSYIHRRVGDRWVIEQAVDLEAHQSNTLNDLVLNDLDGLLKSTDEKKQWAAHVLERLGHVFSNMEKTSNIVLGAQWLFDSYCGSDQMLSFVQTAVVMEILLGEKAASDQTGLGELLANRCAYLISKTREEREANLRHFREIYAVRSSIVHRGKSRLTLEERALFRQLQWMCRRVIQEEISQLAPQKPNS